MSERGDGMQVARHLLDAISWQRINLLETASENLGTFDVVLCRNVFIYFSDKTIHHVLSMFFQRIRPGGSLIVGAAESLARFDAGFRCEERAGAFFYRREQP
ncbi:MAG TPA: CheR family methyltransferase, partial [Polyangiales bacterium]|nr:CheR family methyltransferase [Polyangiales bacterium]